MIRSARIPPALWRFVAAGAVVTAFYVAVTTVLIAGAGAPAQPAVVAAYACTIALHFALNRQFVFSSDVGYSRRLSAQGMRYLVLAGVSYTATAVALAAAERADVPALVAAVGTPVALAAISFVVLRVWVFGEARGESGPRR